MTNDTHINLQTVVTKINDIAASEMMQVELHALLNTAWHLWRQYEMNKQKQQNCICIRHSINSDKGQQHFSYPLFPSIDLIHHGVWTYLTLKHCNKWHFLPIISHKICKSQGWV